MKTHICSFHAGPEKPNKLTYEAFKEAILKAGKFSCFEAAESSSLYNQLCRDPEIKMIDLGYPWTGVKKKGEAE